MADPDYVAQDIAQTATGAGAPVRPGTATTLKAQDAIAAASQMTKQQRASLKAQKEAELAAYIAANTDYEIYKSGDRYVSGRAKVKQGSGATTDDTPDGLRSSSPEDDSGPAAWDAETLIRVGRANELYREIQLLDAAGDAAGSAAAGASGPAARSFLDTEEDKTAEIKRQYNDFAARSDQYMQLLKQEQDLAAGANEMNAAANKALLNGSLNLMTASYAPARPYTSLSQVLGPSLPEYVRPDYRLNTAVGLPGPEGFDDPNYDANGFPLLAFGTRPRPLNALQEWAHGRVRATPLGPDEPPPPWAQGVM